MKPYQFFIRALDELYTNAEVREIKTPKKISRGEFANLSYQTDAIKQGLDSLEQYGGVIIADVVGLGKTIIAATIAYNLAKMRTVVITPPHLKPQWESYVAKFQLSKAEVTSGGKLEDLYRTAPNSRPTLYIIDEAHRYRNESTSAYQMLHQIVRANPKNKVILLTATPYNNHPRDIYALIKLFQIPGRATLNVVDNLGLRFGQLIAEYNRLEAHAKRKLTPEARQQLDRIAEQMRMIIEPVMIRRSRLDLKDVRKYAMDLEKQNISFAKVGDPKTISYDLGELTTLYYQTLEDLNAGKFTGARYKPLVYLADEEKFKTSHGKVFSFSRVQQLNMAELARRLFVLRFESSQFAFRKTLENMITSHRAVLKLWQEKKSVVISKKRTLKKLEEIEDDSFIIASDFLNADFMEDVETDLVWLEEVWRKWFQDNRARDPKIERVRVTLQTLLRENPNRKIVIFTSFADTAQYITKELRGSGFVRTLLYTSTNNHALKQTVRRNFDATLTHAERKDDYDIIVATDALSEGFNLHRAGAIINYDIPYNPTRVIQRIGRINRIDKQMFDKLEVFNLFPTAIGEDIVNIKGISNLKILLMNQAIGNDTKVLNENENLESFWQRQNDNYTEELAWDNKYRNIYNEVKDDTKLMQAVRKIPLGIQIIRTGQMGISSVAMARRGKNIIFMGVRGRDVEVLTPKTALELLQANENESERKIESTNDKNLQKIVAKLAEPYEMPKMFGSRGYALDVIEALAEVCETEKSYLEKLHQVLRRYDDLCDMEIRIIARLNLNDVTKAIEELKREIPEWYLEAIRVRAEQIEATQAEIILIEEWR